ncbi:hypothetical protein [Bosea sp. 685]|uniref:hypothetical protein n=1 Tax=Bosea sp. 685 TaxID=3080057 RepID=UPI0028931273|nr:hypothetical protein [Bosea sp. 685]WNJ89795.1 hypothetical protein RMR04_25910 [Bosea sp. 685]
MAPTDITLPTAISEADIDAMIGMTEYLIEEAVKVSAVATALLGLAKGELLASKMILRGEVASLNGRAAKLM